jgi:hypothetical protein
MVQQKCRPRSSVLFGGATPLYRNRPSTMMHQRIGSTQQQKDCCSLWAKRIESGVTSRRFERLTFRKLQVVLESDALPLRHEA